MTLRNLRFVAFFKSAGRDTSGNVAMIFALGVFVIMGVVGAAVDFSRVAVAKRHLQDAADVAVLRTMGMTSAGDAALQSAAKQALEDNMAKGDDISALTGSLKKTVTDNTMTQTYTASATVTSYFGAFVGQDSYKVNAVSTASVDRSDYEIAFVLDSTGSMKDANKMVNLKSAVDASLNSLTNGSLVTAGTTKVSIVPFNTRVRPGDAVLTGMTTAGLVRSGTTGPCVEDRDQTDNYDVSGAPAQSMVVKTQYLRNTCYSGKLAAVLDMGGDIAKARSYIQTLQPDGGTNITVGMQWGMETLSPQQPFTDAVAFGKAGTKKYMIVVTDGENTQNRWLDANGDSGKTRAAKIAQIDARTALACQAAKDKGIIVYTVKVIEGNSDMLRACASEPGMFYDLTSASQLNAAMAGIFKSIYLTRLTA